MNGTARKITPGTSAATVTGIHTCCAATLGRLDQAALGVLADGTGLFGDQAARDRTPPD